MKMLSEVMRNLMRARDNALQRTRPCPGLSPSGCTSISPTIRKKQDALSPRVGYPNGVQDQAVNSSASARGKFREYRVRSKSQIITASSSLLSVEVSGRS